jgi:hypothetical protein
MSNKKEKYKKIFSFFSGTVGACPYPTYATGFYGDTPYPNSRNIS